MALEVLKLCILEAIVHARRNRQESNNHRMVLGIISRRRLEDDVRITNDAVNELRSTSTVWRKCLVVRTLSFTSAGSIVATPPHSIANDDGTLAKLTKRRREQSFSTPLLVVPLSVRRRRHVVCGYNERDVHQIVDGILTSHGVVGSVIIADSVVKKVAFMIGNHSSTSSAKYFLHGFFLVKHDDVFVPPGRVLIINHLSASWVVVLESVLEQ